MLTHSSFSRMFPHMSALYYYPPTWDFRQFARAQASGLADTTPRSELSY